MDDKQQLQLVIKAQEEVTTKLAGIQKAMLATEVAGKKMLDSLNGGNKVYAASIDAVEKALHKFHDKQSKETEEHKKRIEALVDALKSLGSGNVAGALDVAGRFAGRFTLIAGAAAAAYESVSVFVEGLNKLGDTSVVLNTLAARSAFSRTEFQKMESTLAKMGVTPESARTGTVGFGDFFQRLKERQVSALNQIEGGSAPVNTQTYYRGIEKMSPEEAADTVIKRVLSSKNSAAMQARILNAGGLPGDELAGKSVEKYEEARQKAVAKITDQVADGAEKMQEAGERTKEARDKLFNDIYGHITDNTTKSREQMQYLFEQLDKLGEHAENAGKKIKDWLTDGGRQEREGLTQGERLDDSFKMFGGKDKRSEEDTIRKGTHMGFLDAYKELGGSEGGGIVPAAFHPDGGSIGKIGGLHNGGGYNVMSQGTVPSSMTRGDRNNNPGNLKYGALAKAFGATGADDRGFAVFPNRLSGDEAQKALIGSNAYGGLSLRDFAKKYAEGDADWMKTVGSALGIGPNDIVNNQDPRLLGAIRKAEGTLGGGARANLFSGAPLPYGADVKVRTAGGHSFTANPASADAFKGFVEELEKSGAPIHSIGGHNIRRIAGSGRLSQHAYGNALDINQFARNRVSPDFLAWARSHPDEFHDAIKRWGIVNGGDWRNPDFGHFEWGGKPITKDADVLKQGKQSGLFGAPAKVTGDASVKIALEGFPRGTRTSASSSGIFKEVSLNRGRSMGLASQDG